MEGALYSEVQCIMGNGHMGSPRPPVTRQTTENTTFPPEQKIDISVISVISISPAVVMTFKNGTESVSRIIS